MKRLALIALSLALLLSFGARAEFDDTEFEFSDFADAFDDTSDDDADLQEEALVEDGLTDEQLQQALEAGTFSVTFDDGGYTGEWTSVEDLNIEFFLPDGWVQGDPAEDEYFFAENADGTAQMGIGLLEARYDGTDLAGWAQDNVSGDFSIGLANHQEVVLSIDNEIGRVLVLVPVADGRVIGFNFFRTSVEALSESFALEIAGTCTDLWA